MYFYYQNSELTMPGLHGHGILDQYFVNSILNERTGVEQPFAYPHGTGGYGYQGWNNRTFNPPYSNYGTPSLYRNGVLFTGTNTQNVSGYVARIYNIIVHQGASTAPWSNYNIGRGNRGIFGYFQELIAFNSDQSSNRTALENQINNYYQIY
jgi:hypothetical protein